MKPMPLVVLFAVGALAAAPAVAQEVGKNVRAMKLAPPAAATRGFSIVLVLGDMQSAAGQDNVPAAARKALADMKDFLPYKSYRLLDAEWILGSTATTTRLRGPEDQEYELNLQARGAPRLDVIFQLREAAVTTRPETLAESAAQMQELEQRLLAAQRALETEARGAPERGERLAHMAEIRQKLEAARKERMVAERVRTGHLIDTSFSMDLGETVVVGTSRLRGGDKALIALLTAVQRGAPQK